jgi:hypothetical protein
VLSLSEQEQHGMHSNPEAVASTGTFYPTSQDISNGRRVNGGLLSKSWGENTEMNLLKPLGEGETIKLPKPPVFSVSEINGGSGGIVTTPLGELVDRKDLEGLHSSTVAGGGKPRRRSITE